MDKRREQVRAVLEPRLRDGETLELVSEVKVNGPSAKRTAATVAAATVLATALGGGAIAIVGAGKMYVALSTERLFLLDQKGSGAPKDTVAWEVDRRAITASEPAKRGLLWLGFSLSSVDGQALGRLDFPVPARPDCHRLAEMLGAHV